MELAQVLVVIEGERVDSSMRVPIESEANLTEGIALGRFEDVPAGTRRVVAEFFNTRGVRIGQRTVTTRAAGADTVLTLVFTRSCLGVECGDSDASQCLNGMCVAEECSPENLDACEDAVCSDASDCPEAGADCAAAVCSAGSCFLESLGRCARNQVCVPERGCEDVDAPDAGDAGSDAADAGTDAGCIEGAECPREAACERGRISCETGTATCVADGVLDESVECRSSTGECDLAENCDGSNPVCPEDEFAAPGVVCSAGFCNAGVCGACESGAECDTGNACELGEIRCDGLIPVCVPVGFVPGGTSCRDAAGPCDVGERCTGDSAACPEDRFTLGALCRPSTGDCDPAELCTGSSPLCPDDRLAASGVECRGVAGGCDLAETCTGMSPDCPPDSFVDGGTQCRAPRAECDVPESCSGSDAACPDDARAPSTLVCRAAAGPCDVAETCDGVSVGCPPDGFEPDGFVCAEAECSFIGPCRGRCGGAALRVQRCVAQECDAGACADGTVTTMDVACTLGDGDACTQCGGLGCGGSPIERCIGTCSGTCCSE